MWELEHYEYYENYKKYENYDYVPESAPKGWHQAYL